MKNGLIVDEKGTKFYYVNDQLHREVGPAIEFKNGSKYWYLKGKLVEAWVHVVMEEIDNAPFKAEIKLVPKPFRKM